MLSFFATPWALLGLLAVPALAAIYFLRGRSRPVVVSSLLLWADLERARPGGLRLERLQTPLLFFLELLALALLSVAAAGPTATLGRQPRPLAVVLDDSYSMLAGGDESPRARAQAALREELGRGGPYITSFVLAGRTPQVLGEPARSSVDAVDLLAHWKCHAPGADLDGAIGLASELGGARGVVLVLTDHEPAHPPQTGRVRWRAFGTPRPNVALVSAVRAGTPGQERCVLEVANLSAEPRQTALVVEADGGGVVFRETLRLAPRQTRRTMLRLRDDTPALTAHIGDDALELDNRVLLLPERPRPVRAEVRLRHEALRLPVEKALRATGRVKLVTARPELLWTDQEGIGVDDPDTWLVRLLIEKEAEAFIGPFVLDRTHPLTEGLALQGVVWGAGKGVLPGRPVVLAGNVPLLTDAESPWRRRELRLRLRPDLSTLQDAPAWPVLVWNLVAWRAAQGPGLTRVNLRLGESAILTLAAGTESVEVTAPDGSHRSAPVHDRGVVISADDVGRYEITTPDGKQAFAVNALNSEESDLSRCASGQWGQWQEDTSAGLEIRGLAWILLLLVAAVLTAHALLLARGTGRSNREASERGA